MRILGILNCELESFGLFESVLPDLDVEFECFAAYTGSPIPPHTSYDALVVGGTPVSAAIFDGYPFLAAEHEYLRSVMVAEKPCLGICFGAHLIARLLGADVRKAPSREIGVYELELTSAGKTDPLLRGFPTVFPAFQWHGDTFNIPKGADLLVKGHGCINQMFRCGSAVGVQFHLETTAAEADAWAAAYSGELVEVGKTNSELLSELFVSEPEILTLGEAFIGNFVSWVKTK